MQAHGVAAAGVGVALDVGMEDVEDAALTDHGVVVDVLFQTFPQLHGKFVKRQVAGEQVVGADDGGVAANVAVAEPAFFNHRDAANVVVFGQVIGRGEAMAAAADDDHIVVRRGRGVAPGGLPALMAGEGLLEHGEGGVFHGGASGMGILLFL